MACGPREGDARKYLEEQGFTSITDLKKTDKSFTFSAKKDKDLCTGTVTITKSIGSSAQALETDCSLDTSACKAGAADVCMTLANQLYGQKENVFPMQAAPLYRTACADGKAEGCAHVAEFEGIDKKWDTVREFAKKGCDLGSADACRRLANTEFAGEGAPKNLDGAIALDTRACDLGSLMGCRDLAGRLIDKGKPADAVAPAEKACATKVADSCFLLGDALFSAKQDYPRALEYLDAACKDDKHEGTRGYACNLAGAITIAALGTKRDSSRAMTYFEAACNYQFSEGCSNAGRMYRLGINGVKRDTERGAQLTARACKLGKKEDC